MSTLANGQMQKIGVKDFFVPLAFSFLMCITSFIALPLPFSPVPIAIQPHVALFLPLLIGKRNALLSLVFFLLEGLMGLPVFAKGGFGPLHLLGPTGGYLIGYLGGAFIVGSLIEKWGREKPYAPFLAMLFGNGVIYLFGFLHLAFFVGLHSAFLLGVVPFIIGDTFKLMFFSSFANRSGKFRRV